MSSATVDIVEVEPAAQRVPLSALSVGDTIFDAFGGKHRITDLWLSSMPSGTPLVWILRDDQPRSAECLGPMREDNTITIIPSFDARRSLPETQEV